MANGEYTVLHLDIDVKSTSSLSDEEIEAVVNVIDRLGIETRTQQFIDQVLEHAMNRITPPDLASKMGRDVYAIVTRDE